jgi:hypothetical protein
MSDNTQATGGSWIGFGVTLFLGILSKITLSDVAFIATALAGFSTFAYTIYKWVKGK